MITHNNMPPTKQQLENRRLAEQGLPTIDSTTLQTTDTPITPTVPEIPTTPDISGLDSTPPAEPVLSAPEQDISESIKRATELTGLGEEEKGRRAELELEDPTIVAQRKLQTDLASQLGFLQAGALKETTREEGRLAPQFAIRGAQAQIERQRAVKALGISAQVDASKGLLSSALEKVDRAIEFEFAPRRAELESLLQNIELLKADPRLTIAENKRADERQIAIQKELQGIQEEADEKKAISEIAVDASSLGADALTLRAINNAKTSAEALEIATQKGFVSREGELAEQLTLEKIKTTQYQRRTDEEDRQFDQTLQKAKLGDVQALADLGISTEPTDKITLSDKEAAKLNKELVASDTYKAIVKAEDSWRALSDYEALVKEKGAESRIFSPVGSKKAFNTWNSALLNLKEFYNLGVLNGPDLEILEKILPSTVTVGLPAPVRKKVVLNAINTQKQQMEDKLDNDFLSLKTQYKNYSPDQITNIEDMERKYIQMKSQINPQVKTFLDENPELSIEEALQVINTRL